MRYVWRARNESRACNGLAARQEVIPIILSIILYRKMANSIEDLLEQQAEQIAMLHKHRKRPFRLFSSATPYEGTNLPFGPETARRRRQLYYLIARRRPCIHIDHRGAAYSKLHLYELSGHYRPAKACDLNCADYMIARSTGLAAASPHTVETRGMQ